MVPNPCSEQYLSFVRNGCFSTIFLNFFFRFFLVGDHWLDFVRWLQAKKTKRLAPLAEVTTKQATFTWTQKHQEALDTMKRLWLKKLSLIRSLALSNLDGIYLSKSSLAPRGWIQSILRICFVKNLEFQNLLVRKEGQHSSSELLIPAANRAYWKSFFWGDSWYKVFGFWKHHVEKSTVHCLKDLIHHLIV